MDAKGNAALLKTTKVSEWTLDHSGYFSVLFGGFLLGGCGLAYIIAVSRGTVEPFLPLISDAAGSPPQNGLFGTLICIGGMFGVMFMVMRYMIVLEENGDKSKMVEALNKLSLAVGCISMLGIPLVSGYPANFYRNRDVWLWDVGVPHMIGGVVLFACGLVYAALQCVLTLFLKTSERSVLLTRVVLCLAATAAFSHHMLTVPDNFSGVSHLYYMNDTEGVNTTGRMPYPATMGADLKLPIDTSGTYVSSAIAEWLLVIFFCGFFFTFYKELQSYSLQIVVETHRTGEEHQELPENRKFSVVRRISVSPLPVVETAPDPKKYLRRDSTCQTTTEDVFVAPKRNANGKKQPDAVNGTKKPSKVTKDSIKLDAKLDARLNKIISSMEDDVKTQTAHMSTDCSDLASGDNANCNGQSSVDKEADRIEVISEPRDSSAMLVESNGQMKIEGDKKLSSMSPLSVS